MQVHNSRPSALRPVVMLLAPVLLSATLAGQETWLYRGEAYGSIGAGRFHNGDDYWGSGLQLGSGLGFRPFSGRMHKLGVETRIHHLDFSRTPNATHSSTGNASSITGAVLWHFTDGAAQPYVLTELGVTRTSFTLRTIAEWYDGNPDGTLGQYHLEQRVEQDSTTQSLFGLGLGMKIRLPRHFYLRPESRIDTTPGRGWNFSTLRLAIAGGYYW